MTTKILSFLFLVVALGSSAFGQRAEIAITIDEPFFDALLDGVFRTGVPMEFPLTASDGPSRAGTPANAFSAPSPCKEVVRLLPESGGVRTAVRFHEGKILAPLGFTGSYNPPLVGCVDFSGFAESTIDLDFDQTNQKLVGRVNVYNVALNGTGGMGGTVIARMVQSSLDKKINPIEIVSLEKLSVAVPMKGGTSLNMRAVGFRHEVRNGSLVAYIAYEFRK
jgi:hypothetical protein